MKTSIIIGMQWGDEGKGKIVDVLAKKTDAVARYQGGANAGHTVVINNKKFVLHLLPTGVLQNKISIIGNGVVVDIEELLNEINMLKKQGINIKDLFISERASILLPTHKILDRTKEKSRGKNKIGTTKKGIGPAYIDKYGRKALKMGDMRNKKLFIEKLKKYIHNFNNNEVKFYKIKKVNEKEFIEKILIMRKHILKYIVNTDFLARNLENKNILFEGAQGVMLDIDFGTYPYVTSSHPVSLYAFAGTGIPFRKNFNVIGIVKAYTTRVGEGVFPTRMSKIDEKNMRKKGGEFGATTGRPRNCGWLDLFALKYAAFLNNVNKIALTKMDILSDTKYINVCIGYKKGNKKIDYYPYTNELNKVKPIYKKMKSWTSKDMENLKNGKIAKPIKDYIKLIEKYTNAKVSMLSTGPRRKDIIYLEKL